MKKTRYIILITETALLNYLPLIGQQAVTSKVEATYIYKNCYYIALNGDTIPATILYTDIIKLQHELTIVEADCSIKIFHPGEIKGFGFKNINGLTPETVTSKITDEEEADAVKLHGIVNGVGTFYVSRRVNAEETLTSSADKSNSLYFQSISANNKLKLFIHVKYGIDGTLKCLSYYDVFLFRGKGGSSQEIITVALLDKENKLFDTKEYETARKENVWFSRAIADDTVLATLVKSKKLNTYGMGKHKFVPNIELVINEYNNWRKSTDKVDTSLRLTAIIDAYRYYKPNMFIYTCVSLGYGTFCLPGAIIGAINDHPVKEKNLHIPTNCKYCSDTIYIKTYKQWANKIKTENIYRARTTGFIGIIPFWILVAIIGANENR